MNYLSQKKVENTAKTGTFNNLDYKKAKIFNENIKCYVLFFALCNVTLSIYILKMKNNQDNNSYKNRIF